MRCAAAILTVFGALSASSGTGGDRQLTFEERLAAQAAIERVYYSHQIGATKPFDEAVPRARALLVLATPHPAAEGAR